MSRQPTAKLEDLLANLSAHKIDFTKSFNDGLFRDKAVLVTGGSGGIGSAIVRKFEEAGAYVVIADMDQERGKKLEDEIGMQYGKERVKYIQTDVTSWNSQVAMFRAALSFLPSRMFDIVIICAGLVPHVPNPAPENPKALFDSVTVPDAPNMACIDVGIHGTLYTVQLATKYGMGLHEATPESTFHSKDASSQDHMPASFSKSVIIFGSLWGYADCPLSIDYGTAKWALRGMVRAMRSPLKKDAKLRVNLMAPSLIETPMTAGYIDGLRAQGWRFGDMDVITDAVVRLAGDSSINGRSVCVGPNGMFDLGDDLAGLDGALQMHGTLQRGEMPVLESFLY